MLAHELYQLRDQLRAEEIIFAYSGYVTEAILSGVGDALKQKLAVENATTQTIRSVFSVFVEQMQNIIRYSVEQLPASRQNGGNEVRELRYGILTIGQHNENYMIHAGNVIAADQVPRLRARLAAIQQMTQDELKAAYKRQLRALPDEHSRGAGIGFIEIARRASEPIDFDFMTIDADHAFFVLIATV